MSGTAQGPGPESARRRWADSLALALACYGAGKLSWLLAIAPGREVVFWAPAGIAVGVLLRRGPSVAPGVAAGGFALGIEALLPQWGALGPLRALGIAAALAAGAALEALLAMLLCRRQVSFPSMFVDRHQMGRLAARIGPAPAAVGAAIWTGGMVWAGALAQSQAARSLAVSWLGHLLGILVLAPLVVLVGGRRGEVPWRRRLAVALPVAIAAALAISLYARAVRWDERRAQQALRQRVDAVTAAVEQSVVLHLDTLRAFADFLGGEGRLDTATFRRVGTGAALRHFAYGALIWAPAPDDGAEVRVERLEPPAADRGLLGMNLAAEPAWRAKLSSSRQTGEAVALPVGAGPGEPSICLLVPAWGRRGEHGVDGFLGALLRLDVMIDRAVAPLEPLGIGLLLRDPDGRVLHRSRTDDDRPFAAEVRLPVGDQPFTLVPTVGRAALVDLRQGELWLVLVAGMLFVALLEAVLLVLTARIGEPRRRPAPATPAPVPWYRPPTAAYPEDTR